MIKLNSGQVRPSIETTLTIINNAEVVVVCFIYLKFNYMWGGNSNLRPRSRIQCFNGLNYAVAHARVLKNKKVGKISYLD